MNRSAALQATSFLALALLAACSGGTADTGTILSGAFNVLSTEPQNGGRLFLNDPIRFDFSTPVDLTSADLNAITFSVLDLNGNPVAEQPTGHFELSTRPGDDVVGRRLMFVPTLPTNDTYSDGGFRPGRTYLVRLVGGDRHNNSVLVDRSGKGLTNPQTFRFSTADGTTPAQLFRNIKAGGPRRTSFSVTPPATSTGVALNQFGTPRIEIRLGFDQSLNPNSQNVPVLLDTNPVLRSTVTKGRIYLQYREGFSDVWIPADVDIEDNGLDHAVVLLRPVGVLPNNATIQVIVQATVEDISGESNVGNVAFNDVFATFQTQPAFQPQYDALVENFTSTDLIDFDAAFLEPQAEVGNGFVRAGFDFEGGTTLLDFAPAQSQTINTDFALITPANGQPFNVSGGVFNFRSVTIPAGVIVRGSGTRPMVWLVSNDFTVNGTLTVEGGLGQRVNTLNSANFPTAGGIGACGGGSGGLGSPSSTQRSSSGQPGFGPGQKPAGGGGPGLIACSGGCAIGSGGGGGSMATQGDPFYKEARPAGGGTGFQQVDGTGGAGCAGGSGAATRGASNTPGGSPGPRLFTDARNDNDFWGAAVDQNRKIRIRGELATPVGGEGGGGGGDHSTSCAVVPGDTQFINDNKGGGGGGGGGVLVVKALGTIRIGQNGFIKADGGNAGGGEPAGSSTQGGGGGAGSGGMVILMSAKGIEIFAKNTGSLYTYAQNEYQFSVSADGGICTTSQYVLPDIQQKYALTGTSGAVVTGATYDSRPLGGFGGLGVVQLMAPPGDPSGANIDGTNTVLDDNITMLRALTSGVIETTTGATKQGLLAWRGFPDAGGVTRDDSGAQLAINKNEGEIRPTPILMPAPFSALTRARSKWIDLGAAVRRSVPGTTTDPRSITDPTGTLTGPRFEFAAISDDATIEPSGKQRHLGYPIYDVASGSAFVRYPAVLPTPAGVVGVPSSTTFRGGAAYQVTLQSAAMGAEADRYTGYEAEMLSGSGSVLAGFRILSHSATTVTVAASGPLPAGIASMQVRAKFFSVFTNGAEGLGTTYSSGTRFVPLSNVRVGFAFHTNPDLNPSVGTRFPASGYYYDLIDSNRIETLRQQGLRYVQWDVLFDTRYFQTDQDVDLHPRAFGPTSLRPEIRFLRLPFRF